MKTIFILLYISDIHGVLLHMCFVKRIFIYFLVLLFFKSKRAIHFSLNGPLRQREARLIVCVLRYRRVVPFRVHMNENGFIYSSLPCSDSFPQTSRVGITCTMYLCIIYIYIYINTHNIIFVYIHVV
jgi:hypothetical protein